MTYPVNGLPHFSTISDWQPSKVVNISGTKKLIPQERSTIQDILPVSLSVRNNIIITSFNSSINKKIWA